MNKGERTALIEKLDQLPDDVQQKIKRIIDFAVEKEKIKKDYEDLMGGELPNIPPIPKIPPIPEIPKMPHPWVIEGEERKPKWVLTNNKSVPPKTYLNGTTYPYSTQENFDWYFGTKSNIEENK